jgi:beta-galactosidase
LEIEMKHWTRRDLLKTSLAAPAMVAASAEAVAEGEPQTGTPAAGAPSASPGSAAGRERLLLDFGWRFHFGHAADPAQDFNFRGNFSKTGNFGPVATALFDDSDWKSVDLPHDWAIELPFTDDSQLSSKGFYPLGRSYPATSIGWYRRIFELPASDAGRRITIEFDAAYREATVIFNGFYIGRHIGGYDPFSYDVTDFATPGSRNVLLVRVNATESDGWFYEGAGIYRHVWLVKTSPVHVKKWGAFARTEVRPGEAIVRIRTEVENHGKGAQNTRVTSTILDPAGRAVGKVATLPASIAEGEERSLRAAGGGEGARAMVARRAQSVQAGDRDRSGRCRHGPHGDAVRHPHLRVRRREGLLPQRQIRQAQRDLQPPGPRRRRRGAARRGAIFPRSQAPGDGLQRPAHLAQSAYAGAA